MMHYYKRIKRLITHLNIQKILITEAIKYKKEISHNRKQKIKIKITETLILNYNKMIKNIMGEIIFHKFRYG